MLALIVLLSACHSPSTPLQHFEPGDTPAAQPHPVGELRYAGQPDDAVKNVIFVIGDGMGLAAITAGMAANRNQLWLENFEVIGLQKTASSNSWITDSAAAGTALATGHKTTNGAVGVDATGAPVQTLIELAEARGLSTGMVVTSELTHGTPAAFSAHNVDRGQGWDIAAQQSTQNIDVLIGGGRAHFDQRDDGRDLVAEMAAGGYVVADSIEAVGAVRSTPMLGFIDTGRPAYRLEGRGETLRLGTDKALELLSADEDGFFLLVEASQIDWGGHDNAIAPLVTEMLDLDRTLESVLRFAKSQGNTLVIVTADHETGGLALHGGDVAQGSLDASFATSGHTGHMVPVFAWGPQAHRFAGIYENTEVFTRIFAAYGW